VNKEDRTLAVPERPAKAIVAVLSGEFDIASKESLRSQLEALAGVPRLCLDLSNVQYIDSTAIGELIRLHKLRVERGFDTEALVIGQNQPIRRLLHILHMGSLFRIAEDMPSSFQNPNDGVARRTIAFVDGALQTTDSH
jgi:anti-anti-sigma factor